MSEIQITVKEGSIEHVISEFRKSGRKCRDNDQSPEYISPLQFYKWYKDEALLNVNFELEPISKAVTAEQVREAVTYVFTNHPAQPSNIMLKLICEKLGLE